MLQKVQAPRITWTSASEMLLQLRDGRQQLLALVTTEGQLQEHSGIHLGRSLCQPLAPSQSQLKGKNVQSPDTLESQDTKIFLKENLIPNMPNILKSSKLEVTLTVEENMLGQIHI